MMKSLRMARAGAAIALGLLSGVAIFSIYSVFSVEPLEDMSVSPHGAQELSARAQSARGETAPADAALPTRIESADPSPHADALRHPSETFRNTSLTTVIREAGFVCTRIVSAAPGARNLGVWRVSCEGAMVYLVAEDERGALHVEPMPLVEAPVVLPVEPAAPENERGVPRLE